MHHVSSEQKGEALNFDQNKMNVSSNVENYYLSVYMHLKGSSQPRQPLLRVMKMMLPLSLVEEADGSWMSGVCWQGVCLGVLLTAPGYYC